MTSVFYASFLGKNCKGLNFDNSSTLSTVLYVSLAIFTLLYFIAMYQYRTEYKKNHPQNDDLSAGFYFWHFVIYLVIIYIIFDMFTYNTFCNKSENNKLLCAKYKALNYAVDAASTSISNLTTE